MTSRLPTALPDCVSLVGGTYFGLEALFCPPWAATLLLALGLALRGQLGRTVAFLAVGLLSGVVSSRPDFLPAADRPVVMRVRVTGAWRTEEDGLRAAARGLWLRQGLQVMDWDRDLRLVLPRGSSPPRSPRLRVKGYLRRPVAPANGVRVGHAMWILRVKSAHFVTSDSRNVSQVLRLWHWIATNLRRPVEQRLADLERRERGLGATLVRVLVLGQSERLPGAIARGLRSAGLAHLVALSGLHVGLLVGSALIVTAAAPLRFRFLLAICLALAYVLLAGARPSLIRAFLMMMSLMASSALQRPPQPLNVLSWVAAAMVLVDPRLVGKIGFQLTVAATGGILLLSTRLQRRWCRLPESLRKPLSVSVAAHLAVLPWTLSLFHLAAPLSPLWNLLAVPWAACFLVTAFAWVLGSVAIPPLGTLLSPALDLLAGPLAIFGDLPPEVLGAVPVDFGGWVAVTLAGALTLALMSAGWTRLAALVVVVLCCSPSLRRSDVNPELILLDVGQGEAIILRDGKEVFLVDGGGWRRADIAQKILLPALTRIGVHRLTGMILSHPDTDHCGGLLMLTSYMSVRRLHISAGWSDDSCVTELLTRPGIEVRSLWRGEQLRFGRWHLRALHPKAGNRTGRNDRSLVLLAETGGHKVLLTGDLEAAGERQILATMDLERVDHVDVLKVGHHGSSTSTTVEWLDRVRPRIALISCGVANRYGHPDPRVLQRLRNRRATLCRTDLLGMIRISFGPGTFMRLSFPGQPREMGL